MLKKSILLIIIMCWVMENFGAYVIVYRLCGIVKEKDSHEVSKVMPAM